MMLASRESKADTRSAENLGSMIAELTYSDLVLHGVTGTFAEIQLGAAMNDIRQKRSKLLASHWPVEQGSNRL